jgi:cytochrome c oxidase assembly protein subunit 15
MKLRPWALIAFAALAVQIFLGGWTSTNYAAVACPDLPTCQRAWWPPMDFHNAFVLWRGLHVDFTGGILSNAARTAIHVTHRIGAVIAGSILIIVGAFAIYLSEGRRLRVAGTLLIVAVLLQISIGLSMVHLGMPLTLAVFHNAGAALLVIALTTLVRTLWPARH